MPTPVLIALIAVLAVHYVLAIATIYILLKDKLSVGQAVKASLIIWNIVILLIPIIGPLSYLVYRQFAKKK